ncbi:hypothetical protein HYR99_18015 [Candidatus Poribacteria bacterium]|nr:hypothetical protein [Candidatus Poribacteria bacterium]
MNVYLDVSVLVAYLFGQLKEPIRYETMSKLFNKLYRGDLRACISLYAFQELYAFCQENYPAADVSEVFRLALLKFLAHPLQIMPLLTRHDRLIYERRFIMSDASDKPHVISAHLADAMLSWLMTSIFKRRRTLLPC